MQKRIREDAMRDFQVSKEMDDSLKEGDYTSSTMQDVYTTTIKSGRYY